MTDYVQREKRNGVPCVVLTEKQYEDLMCAAKDARSRHNLLSHSYDRESKACPRCQAILAADRAARSTGKSGT